MRNCEEKEERLMLLESWRNFEEEFGTESSKERVDKLMPEKVKKRRKLQAEDGVRAQIEDPAFYNWRCLSRQCSILKLELAEVGHVSNGTKMGSVTIYSFPTVHSLFN